MSAKFQQRHYEAIAKVLHGTQPEHDPNSKARLYQWRHTRDRMALMLGDDNPNFNLTRFLVACGDSSGVEQIKQGIYAGEGVE